MKDLQFKIIIISISILGCLGYLFWIDYSHKAILGYVFAGLLIWLLFVLFRIFAIPTDWAYRNRFGIEGLLLIIPIMLFSSLINHQSLTLKSLIPISIIGFPLGFFIIGALSKRNHNRLMQKISVDRIILENEILTDLATCMENNKYIRGKLILTTERLYFIPLDTTIQTTELNLAEHRNAIKQVKFGKALGIFIREDLIFYVAYHKLWIKKIKT